MPWSAAATGIVICRNTVSRMERLCVNRSARYRSWGHDDRDIRYWRNRAEELEAKAPTPDAYEAACKALAHWRKEARRLGKLAGAAPREMSK